MTAPAAGGAVSSEAARALGAKPFTIIRKYVFYNVVQNVPPIATLNAADAILTLTALGFLGYGVQPTEAAEWGYDIQRAVSDASSNIWWTGTFPGLAIVLLVTGITLPPAGRWRSSRTSPAPSCGSASSRRPVTRRPLSWPAATPPSSISRAAPKSRSVPHELLAS